MQYKPVLSKNTKEGLINPTIVIPAQAGMTIVGLIRPSLKKIGPVRAFMKLRSECSIKPSLNFLYAMVGALEERHWAGVAKTERGRLLLELDGYQDLERALKAEGVEIET